MIPLERNSEHKIVIIVVVVLALKVLGVDAATVMRLIGEAKELDAQVQASTGLNLGELGLVGIAAVYNWGRGRIKQTREAKESGQ